MIIQTAKINQLANLPRYKYERYYDCSMMEIYCNNLDNFLFDEFLCAFKAQIPRKTYQAMSLNSFDDYEDEDEDEDEDEYEYEDEYEDEDEYTY
ncbi:MAG: hypothetical protein QNJ47_26955 [Nostocaceae cyanobacterium]|nr:hypothetical protein [Nostocaceae cyanobacterium]